MFVDIDVKELDVTLCFFYSINKLGFKCLAGTAPGSTSLDNCGLCRVLDSIVEASLGLHLSNVNECVRFLVIGLISFCSELSHLHCRHSVEGIVLRKD
jgi:hypothetical protein